MLKTVVSVLMDTYGYEPRRVITHPSRDKYDVMLASGPVVILLTDNSGSETVSMRIVEGDLESKTSIYYGRHDYEGVILEALLEFALRRMHTPSAFIAD